MGKKGRKTRWRTLTITDEHSDSEESNTTTSGHRVPKGYPQKSYYSRFTYSSQSTPTRRYQCDGTKSTRSSSTASENKITFNEGFEPYPVMVYNPPTYYPEFTSVKSKRCSTGSLTESTSPNNEETSQDLSQSETPSNVSDINHVYNVIYPGFYYNGACQPQVDAASQAEPRRVKKRRRRKVSRSKSTQEGSTSESSDEVFSDEEPKSEAPIKEENPATEAEEEEENEVEKPEEKDEQKKEESSEATKAEDCPKSKYDLKPDAEEFVPRAYRHPETIPLEANVQFIKIPSNFVPVPILNPMGDFNAFIPPAIPINFIPQNYINFIPYKTQNVQADDERPSEKSSEGEVKETVEVPKSNQIDIAKIVSKLEEAAKEQDEPKVKEETTSKSVPRKRHRYQKVDLKAPPPTNFKPELKKPAWREANTSPKKEAPTTPKRNYSDTLKKSMTVQQCERHERNMEKMKMHRTPVKEAAVRNHVRVENTPSKTSDEWISVSSRKKRKNKNVEEAEDVEENSLENLEPTSEDKDKMADEVKDVCPVQEVAVVREASPAREVLLVEEVLPMEEVPPVEEVLSMKEESEVEEVSQVPIEEEALLLEEASPVKEICSVKEIVPVVSQLLEAVENVPTPTPTETRSEESKEEKKVTKKKSKKNHAKTPVPPPIIKRVMIKDIDLSLEQVEVKVKECRRVEVVNQHEEVIEEPVSIEEESVKSVMEQKKESPEKKPKKKKKKVSKVAVLSSQSSSNTTLNVPDDSYDFLLDESLDKTNVEVSQELDKMIQRGMYSSLEEKIKSMNIESNDNFFKSIIHNISTSRESSVEKNNYKNPDLSKILNNSSLLKTKPNLDRKPGDFLGEPTPKTVGGENSSEPQNDDSLYPITKAVKEWMTKTRETTPDVEILKSPSMIFREFGEDGDEVTIYSCWEEKVRKTSTSSVEEGEDVLEVYESKYGSNEDYSKIQAEVEERKGNYPKHGNLPYRAICCSIM
ncbi:neurofilament heavy polypeptide-like isoform X6 [Tenebrio molitor]|uniref:neurofilament heavy polypeptide-like isoform X6 n=1 Tax=Tenebrio molitor TaxID=7067 RepID=UPI0036248C1C